MLTKNSDQSLKSRCFGQKKRFKFLSKMTRSAAASPYERMDNDVQEKKKKDKKSDVEDKSQNKENKEVKDKKKSRKKTWKLIRQATLTTCRYIGLGVAHMNPAATYVSPDYCVDPKLWDRSFTSRKAKQQPPTQPRYHWSNNMMFASW